MKKKSRGVLSGLVVCVAIVLLLFASGSALAQRAKQGEVALNLVFILGLNLPAGATAADAVGALTALGISPSGGWNADAPASSGFITSLYISVEAAFTAGKIAPTAGLGSASAAVAAACTSAGIPSSAVVNAIANGGGNARQARQGATMGLSVPGTVASFGPAGGGGVGGGGGGGGGISPSPSK